MRVPVLLAIGLAAAALAGCALAKANPGLALDAPPPVRAISLTGPLVCAPLRETATPTLGVCALALQDSSGRTYRLRERDLSSPRLGGLALGTMVLVAGTLSADDDARFATAGEVAVLAVNRLGP